MLLIETHSPWQSHDSADFLQLARTLLGSGAIVHLHLIQNAVLWLQQEAETLAGLRRQFDERLLLTFDDVSLDLRGIPHAAAAPYGPVRDMDALMAEMADRGVKTIWHS